MTCRLLPLLRFLFSTSLNSPFLICLNQVTGPSDNTSARLLCSSSAPTFLLLKNASLSLSLSLCVSLKEPSRYLLDETFQWNATSPCLSLKKTNKQTDKKMDLVFKLCRAGGTGCFWQCSAFLVTASMVLNACFFKSRYFVMADGSEDDPMSRSGRYLWDIHRKYPVARIQCWQLAFPPLHHVSNDAKWAKFQTAFQHFLSVKPLDTVQEESGHLQQNMTCWWPDPEWDLCLNTTRPESQCRHSV